MWRAERALQTLPPKKPQQHNTQHNNTHEPARPTNTRTRLRCTDHSHTKHNRTTAQLNMYRYTIRHPRRCCVDAVRCSRGTPMLWCFTKRRAAAAAIVRARARAYFVDCSCRRVAGVRCEFASSVCVCVWCCYGTIIFYRYVCAMLPLGIQHIKHTRARVILISSRGPKQPDRVAHARTRVCLHHHATLTMMIMMAMMMMASMCADVCRVCTMYYCIYNYATQNT